MYENYGSSQVVKNEEGCKTYISKVYGWMFLGLVFTAVTAYVIAGSPDLVYSIASNRLLFFGLIIGEFALVIYLSGWIRKMGYGTAVSSFMLYSVLNGVTLSVVLLAYTSSSVAYTFGITAATFGIMAVYGYVTRTDLTRAGNLLFMGLIGVIILSVVNIFMHSSTLEWAISVIGLFVFLGLTAYDTQKIKAYYYSSGDSVEMQQKVAVLGALSLYLDFINLFLIMLRLFGRGRD